MRALSSIREGLPAGTWRPLLRRFRKPCSGKPAPPWNVKSARLSLDANREVAAVSTSPHNQGTGRNGSGDPYALNTGQWSLGVSYKGKRKRDTDGFCDCYGPFGGRKNRRAPRHGGYRLFLCR